MAGEPVHEITIHYTNGVDDDLHLQIDGRDTQTDWPGFANDWFADGLANAEQWAYLLGITGTVEDFVIDPGDIDMTGAPPEAVLPPGPWIQRTVEIVGPTAPDEGRAAQAALDVLGGEDVGLLSVVQAMAEALAPIAAVIPGLQVSPYLNYNPTPPSIDIYPADLFQQALGFNGDDREAFFTVRARTTTADSIAGQRALLQMLDRRSAASVEGALTEDQTLGGRVQSLAVAEDGISGYREYLEDAVQGGRLIGCEWRVEVLT